ncbi:MSP domain protein [Dictyocaulus viviparus]|uniref:Major sperm protein n=1 Tax=Dictyocaulus viviparus TaxID=29172 RepID=A0A0D8YEV8_DICVI|nr:MSP domain protein [Dictyocaulus viviparus]
MSKVNVNTLKEIKDLKESENRQNRSKDMENQQDRNAVCPPFLKQPAATPPSPRLTAINPLILVFDGAANTQCQKVLHISNVSNERVAWRVLCNAPTRYVVTPNKGFLFRQEKITVQVLLLNSSKYHRRHAFVVQVKPAKIEESNRKLTWKDLSPNEMKVIQSTRVSTLSPNDEMRTAKG